VSVKAIGSVVPACVLAACANLKYQPEADEPAARLRHVSYEIHITQFSLYDAEAFPQRKVLSGATSAAAHFLVSSYIVKSLEWLASRMWKPGAQQKFSFR
jgi:hypothetical protein